MDKDIINVVGTMFFKDNKLLISGAILRLLKCNVCTVEKDNRAYVVETDNRICEIDKDNRIYIVPHSNTVYSVEKENNIYEVVCKW